MSRHSDDPGGGWDGYATQAHTDDKPLSPEFVHLFPPGTVGAARAPNGQQQEKRTLVYPPKPRGKKKRGKPKKAK